VEEIPEKLEELDVSIGEQIASPEMKKVEEPEPTYPSLHEFMFGKGDVGVLRHEQPIDLSISHA